MKKQLLIFIIRFCVLAGLAFMAIEFGDKPQALPCDLSEGCPAVCPDNSCDPGETCVNCPEDCGDCQFECDNGYCEEEQGETCDICPEDCGDCPAVCPDTFCDPGETCENCPEDCGQCPPLCDPPNTVGLNGRCVPSCGFAGGDTCINSESTQCDYLPLIESYDCDLCCERQSLPQPVPNSHHIVVIAGTGYWNSILELSSEGKGPIITSQNKPSSVSWENWTRNIHHSWYANGAAMADKIHNILSDPAGAPIKVLIDELKPVTIGKIRACATRMRTRYPQWEGRWGAYLVVGENVSYPRLNPAIDALLDANAIIVPEMYIRRSRYCQSGSSARARDIWLAGKFRGTPTLGRFHWLSERRRIRNSTSQLTIMFGVTDYYMDGINPAIFLDRMFYVWATRTGYRGAILQGNGGVGAYKWEYGFVGTTGRDLAFKKSFEHYCINAKINSRLGQVPCP